MEIADSITSVINNKSSVLWSTEPDSMVFDAIQLMSEKNIGALLVMDSGELVGIVSERDYTRKVILKGKSSKDTPVKNIMTTDLVTMSTQDTVAKGLQTMTERAVRHLPVFDGEKLVGIVSIGDLVRWIMSAQGALIEQLEGYIQGGYS